MAPSQSREHQPKNISSLENISPYYALEIQKDNPKTKTSQKLQSFISPRQNCVLQWGGELSFIACRRPYAHLELNAEEIFNPLGAPLGASLGQELSLWNSTPPSRPTPNEAKGGGP